MVGSAEYLLVHTPDELDRLIAYAAREAQQVELTCRTVELQPR